MNHFIKLANQIATNYHHHYFTLQNSSIIYANKIAVLGTIILVIGFLISIVYIFYKTDNILDRFVYICLTFIVTDLLTLFLFNYQPQYSFLSNTSSGLRYVKVVEKKSTKLTNLKAAINQAHQEYPYLATIITKTHGMINDPTKTSHLLLTRKPTSSTTVLTNVARLHVAEGSNNDVLSKCMIKHYSIYNDNNCQSIKITDSRSYLKHELSKAIKYEEINFYEKHEVIDQLISYIDPDIN